METRSKSKRIGPLPGGDRRGTPGADAGCHSMRTVSGEELNRRAPTDKDATAENTGTPHSPIEPYSPSTISYTPSLSSSPSSRSTIEPTPVLDVAREANAFLPASTKAGKPRVRMKWNKDVNIFIMRTYYLITKLETDFSTYRKELHELFSRKYPSIHVTEQRVADQRRTIVRNKLLSQDLLNQIKEEVKSQIEIEEEIANETNQIQILNQPSNLPTFSTHHTIQTQLQQQSQNFLFNT